MIFYSFKVFGAKGLQPLSIAFNVFQYHFQCSILLHFWGLKCKCWRKLSANNFVISILQKEVQGSVSSRFVFLARMCLKLNCLATGKVLLCCKHFFALELRQTSPILNPILRTWLTFKIGPGGLQLPRRRI